MVWVSNLNEQSLTPRFSSDFFWISCLVSAMLFSLTLKVFFMGDNLNRERGTLFLFRAALLCRSAC